MNKLIPLLFLAACSSDRHYPVNELPQAIQDEMESESYVQPEPITEPLIQPEPEILVMAPQTPYVFYTLTEEWYQPENVRRPIPRTQVQARVQFDTTGAEFYNIIRDDAIVAPLTDESEPYTFRFFRSGQPEFVDPNTFPSIQVMAVTQEVSAVSDEAEWVME